MDRRDRLGNEAVRSGFYLFPLFFAFDVCVLFDLLPEVLF